MMNSIQYFSNTRDLAIIYDEYLLRQDVSRFHCKSSLNAYPHVCIRLCKNETPTKLQKHWKEKKHLICRNSLVEMANVLHMNGGLEEASYALNSLLQVNETDAESHNGV
ncbi:unnamed protein product [Linum tenue]|uniref:Uncharacterized protein n=1 Tax=Linum tenue TaxID=586396 RepID=A0AAV0MBL1_9ROSI|nr:unnamed protein product [Linum tenue]